MKLSKMQFKVLCVLWSSEKSLSIREIAQLGGYRFAGETIVRLVMEDLLAKGAAYRSGSLRDCSQHNETVELFYAPKIHFEDYYAKKFETVAPHRLFNLLEKLLSSDLLEPQMRRELGIILAGRTSCNADYL